MTPPVHNASDEQLGFALAGMDAPDADETVDIEVCNTETPECPMCNQDHGVYCLECGNDYMACQCDPDEYESYFWCLNCDAEFLWDPNFMADDDDLWDDVENDVVDVVVAEDVLECKCSPQKQYVCGVCNVERDKPDAEWRPYRADGKSFTQLLAGETKTDVEPACVCEPECNYYCAKCKVRRSSPQSKWEWLSDSQKKKIDSAQAADKKQSAATKAKTAATATTKTSTWSSGSYGYGGWYKCRHYGESLTFPDGTEVWASSSNSTRKPGEFVPDFGLYLDWTWKPTWRAEFIDWRDFGLPTNEEAAVEAIVDMYRRAKEGWRIEVGCIGGHGRTGTALACMGVLAGLSPKEAIKYVRKNYCTETLENAKQEWWVEWFDAYVNLKPIPEMPNFPTKTYTKTASTTTSAKSTACTLEEHYKMWRAGATDCTIKAAGNCSFWKQDKTRFDKNDIPENLRAKDAAIDAEIAAKEVTVSVVIDGYLVPKPKKGEWQHVPTARQGCKCDYCRYTAKHGAFLTPSAKPDKIKIGCANGEVVEISIDNAKFRPLPPSAEGGSDGVMFDDYVWSEAHGWVWHKLNQGSDAEKKAASEKLADAIESPDKSDDSPVVVDDDKEVAERPTDLPDDVQEPEELVTPYTLKVLTAGLHHLLDRAPTASEIRIAIKEFTDVEWLDTINRGEFALAENACLICGRNEHATDHHYYCITCKDWADHSTTKHDAAMQAEAKSSEVPIYCLGCQTYTSDHRTSTCPANAEIDAHIATMDKATKRDRNKKKNKRTKGGAKSKQKRKVCWVTQVRETRTRKDNPMILKFSTIVHSIAGHRFDFCLAWLLAVSEHGNHIGHPLF